MVEVNLLLLANADILQQVQDYIRGCKLKFKKARNIYKVSYVKVRETRMDKPESQPTLGAWHSTKTSKTKTTQKTKKMSNADTPKKRGLNWAAREGLVVPVSYPPVKYLIKTQ